MRNPARLHFLDRNSEPVQFRTAVSLHSHTFHSKESLAFMPRILAKVPMLAAWVGREVARAKRERGRVIDFRNAWWTPVPSPQSLLDSEREQIARRFGSRAIVSITDHDDIEAGSHLRVVHPDDGIPISLEWTVPIGRSQFHIGVHNLPSEDATSIFAALRRYTLNPNPADLPSLFAILDDFRETLVVLNHCLWDIGGAGPARHVAALIELLRSCGRHVHALEINGFRPWKENSQVLTLAEEMGFTVVSGGDRHGLRPNAFLNITSASTFQDFAGEVRIDRRSEILVLQACGDSIATKTFQVAADSTRTYPQLPIGRQRCFDRVFIRFEGEQARPIAFYWPNGGPAWLRVLLWAFLLTANWSVSTAFRFALAEEGVLP